MKRLSKLALSGLVAVLPVAVTLYVLWWLGSRAEAILGGLLKQFLPEALYVPGAGLVLGFALLIGVGMFMRALLAQRLAARAGRMLDRIPLVKTVYGAVSDLLSVFSARTDRSIDQVVLVTFADTQIRMLGLVTRSEVPEVGPGSSGEPLAAVYLPMSYGIGGRTTLVPCSTLTPVEMSVSEALRFAITAGAPSKARLPPGRASAARESIPDRLDRATWPGS